jgi:hypothetical protein
MVKPESVEKSCTWNQPVEPSVPGTRLMGSTRFRFADEPPAPQPRNFWIPRLLMTSLFVGAAAVANIWFGFRLF